MSRRYRALYVCSSIVNAIVEDIKSGRKSHKNDKMVVYRRRGHIKTPLTSLVDETFLQEHNLSNLTNENCLEIKIREGKSL